MALDGTNNAAGAAGDGAQGGDGAAGGAAQEPKWFDSFPDDLKAHADIVAFKGPDELAKAFIDTKGKVPVVPEKYEFGFPAEFDKEYIEHATAVAKEIGLTQEQFARLAKADVESLSRATEEAVAKQKGVVETLRKEWGAQTDERVKKADAVLTAILGDAWAQHFAFDKHPEVIKAFYDLSTRLSEDTIRLPGATQTGGPKVGPDGNPILAYPNTPTMNK
jgi:hypothetical protein